MLVLLLTEKFTFGYYTFLRESLMGWRRKNKIEYLILVQKLNSELVLKVCKVQIILDLKIKVDILFNYLVM